MKTDRELLELVAKAAAPEAPGHTQGWHYSKFGPRGEGMYAACDRSQHWFWNPLTDDGDALRLAVKRRIKVRYNEALGQALAWTMGAKEADAITVNIEDCSRDECSATRLAIVLASIGEATS